jgi:hypothetical protein
MQLMFRVSAPFGRDFSAVPRRSSAVQRSSTAFGDEVAVDGNGKINRLHGNDGCPAERADPPVPARSALSVQSVLKPDERIGRIGREMPNRTHEKDRSGLVRFIRSLPLQSSAVLRVL